MRHRRNTAHRGCGLGIVANGVSQNSSGMLRGVPVAGRCVSTQLLFLIFYKMRKSVQTDALLIADERTS